MVTPWNGRIETNFSNARLARPELMATVRAKVSVMNCQQAFTVVSPLLRPPQMI
jgi:hypothetical protein